MPLAFNARGVGTVTVVQCSGRIVAGSETDALRAHISGMMQDRKDFVLHLGDVAFIDSSGLGTMVRLLTTTRKSHGDLKLCNVPQAIEKLLKMSNLNLLFETHDSRVPFPRSIGATPRRKIRMHTAHRSCASTKAATSSPTCVNC